MPRLGWDMKVGRLGEWVKHDGDAVDVGEVICTVEGDKATSELESMDSGVLRIPPGSPPPGEEVPVGTLLAYLVQPGESTPAPSQAGAPTAETAAPPGATVTLARPAAAPGRGRHVASPRARRAAADLGVDLASLVGSGRTGRVLERDVQAAASARPATPAALAAAAGATAQRRQAPPATAAASGVRRLIAARMAESAHTSAPVTLTTEADATALVRLRSELKRDLGALAASAPVPTYNDLLVRLVAVALGEHPNLNASFQDGQVVQHDTIHVGLAVDTERGLLVPVVRDVQRKSVQDVARELLLLVDGARQGTIAADALRGGTFTITNLGVYEIDSFTPIINLPECAILGVGRIVARPVVVDEASEEVSVRKMMALSLTFDHRVVDGAPAARFLQRIKQFVEHPGVWLTR